MLYTCAVEVRNDKSMHGHPEGTRGHFFSGFGEYFTKCTYHLSFKN